MIAQIITNIYTKGWICKTTST